MTENTEIVGAAAGYLADSGAEVLADFARLLQLPNVTGSVDDLRVNARELVRRFEERGAAMEMIELGEASPVVIGELRTESPTATLGVYVHYDGQPVDPATWTVPPFSATLTSGPLHDGGESIAYPGPGDEIDPEWRIYGRGASDDKTPLAAIAAALQALDRSGVERTVDLVFLFEGEEESG
ncbi:MAG: M20/M25/M40 family metallo-hydrolase, partial [Acidimicrobiia bacterium]